MEIDVNRQNRAKDTMMTNNTENETITPYQEGDKWGYRNSEEKVVITPKYDEVKPFVEGIARVKLNGKWGLIDINGEEITPLKYDEAGFSLKVSRRLNWTKSGAM